MNLIRSQEIASDISDLSDLEYVISEQEQLVFSRFRFTYSSGGLFPIGYILPLHRSYISEIAYQFWDR